MTDKTLLTVLALFSKERRNLFTVWLQAWVDPDGSVMRRERSEFWAAQIRRLNDAQLELDKLKKPED